MAFTQISLTLHYNKIKFYYQHYLFSLLCSSINNLRLHLLPIIFKPKFHALPESGTVHLISTKLTETSEIFVAINVKFKIYIN